LSLDANERVTALALHRHNETPEYLGDLQPFLADFLGKEAPLVEYGQPEKANGIHAMTGATVTGQAVVESVRRTGAALRLKRLEVTRSETQAQEALSAAASVESNTFPSPWMQWKLWLVALLGLVGIALYFFAAERWRLVYLILILAVSGVYLNAQVTLSESLRLLGSPSPFGNPLLVVGLGTLLLGVLLAGPLFCGYLCPFGALQELLSRMGLRWRVALPMERRLRRVKYLVAAAALLASLLVGLDRAFRFDPLTYAFCFHWDGLALSMLLLLLAGSLVIQAWLMS